MGIVHVGEKWEAMQLTETLQNGLSGTRQFQVISDNPNELPSTVLADSRLPQFPSTFPGTSNCYLMERIPNRTAGTREEWIVDLSYSQNVSQDQRDKLEHPNPIDRKAVISWDTKKEMRSFRMIKRSDYYKQYTASIENTFSIKSATNSVGDPFEPTLQYPCSERVATIRKNVGLGMQDWILTYEDAVNNADFQIDYYGSQVTIKKGCAKVSDIKIPVAKAENGYDYLQLSMVIHIREKRDLRDGETEAPEPWDDEILNVGTRYLAQGATTLSQSDPAYDPNRTVFWKDVVDPLTELPAALPVPFRWFADDGYLHNPVIPGDANGKIKESDMWWSLVAPYSRKDFSVLPLT